jgi:hypothetical protein
VTNPIPAENALAGIADSTVGYATMNRGADGFYGFARQFSTDAGNALQFSVDGVGAANIAIHRIGHYGGLRWRLVETITNAGVSQPEVNTLPSTNGCTSAANWSATATWNIPSDAVSGLYVGVVRDASNVPRSWIPFIVRNDGRTADIVIRVSDTTWGGAYNFFGTKAAPLDGKSVYGQGAAGSVFDINLRGVRMSYDRPIVTRSNGTGTEPFVNHWDILESALIDWVERNGFNVKYISCYDLDQGLGAVGAAKVLACAGHDEYWSDGMVDNTEAFIAAGGHHVSMSANSQFWRIRWADSGRSFWCYKDTMPGPTGLRTGGAGTPLDPVSWTGTWRDTRWPQRRPENLLLGATFRMNGINDFAMVINGPANQAKPFWRSTTVAAGTSLSVSQIIGFEADSLNLPNAGGVNLGATTINIDGSYANDDGETYNNNGNLNWGIACHYPRPDPASGLSVHFSTNQWMWGLSNYHRRGGAVINREMRQATYNLLTDLGATAATKESDLTAVSPVALSTYGATRPAPTGPTVTVAVSPGSVAEDGTPNLIYTFTRTTSVGALNVNYTIGGTATNGTDYATIASPVNIADGSATATVTVNPTADATSEANETVILTIAAGSGYNIGSPSSATGTINNDDAALPTVSVAVSPSSTDEDGAGNLVYTFTRAGSTAGALNVNYTIGGTATNGTDYATIASPVNIADGSATATVTVNPTTDATLESNETVILTVTSGSGYTVGSPASATGTITNDDGAPVFYQLTPDATIGTDTADPLDDAGYEMGTIFTVSSNCNCYSVKFRRPSSGFGTHGFPLAARTWTCRLWDNGAGTVLATATFSSAGGETGVWFEAVFSSPIPLTTGVTYQVSTKVFGKPMDSDATGYAAIPGFFASAVTPGGANPLSAPANAGRFNATPGVLPAASFGNAYYLVQPVVTL